MASFFTLVTFFVKNKLFQRGLGVFVLLCGNSTGVGGHQFLTNMENRGRWGGGGFLSEILSVVGYRYFLEPHILRLKNKAKRKGAVAGNAVKV